eukprot:6015001-Pleurochrysis_carterae.AAC.1
MTWGLQPLEREEEARDARALSQTRLLRAHPRWDAPVCAHAHAHALALAPSRVLANESAVV